MNLSSEEKQLILNHRKSKRKTVTVSRTLESYGRVEKCAAFDRLYAMALENFNKIVEDGREVKDFDNYAGEEIMQLLGKDIYDKINPLLD